MITRFTLLVAAVILLIYARIFVERPPKPYYPYRELLPGEVNPPLVKATEADVYRPGQRIWHRTNATHTLTVVETSADHEFPSGETIPGVLTRDHEGNETWIPRRSMNGVWIERDSD